MTTNNISLNDGRNLSYAEYGDSNGKPIIYFHGMPGSRLEQSVDNSSGIHLIIPERPGYGASTPVDSHTPASYSHDIAQLCEALEIEEASLIGYSMGGMYALAFAAQQSEIANKLTLVSSIAPIDGPNGLQGLSEINQSLIQLAQQNSEMLKAQLETLADDVEVVFQALTASLPATEQALFEDEVIANAYKQNLSESIKQGATGIAIDYFTLAGEWGFSIDRVACPTTIWHGKEDISISISMAEQLCSLIPNAELNCLNEGHYLIMKNWGNISE